MKRIKSAVPPRQKQILTFLSAVGNKILTLLSAVENKILTILSAVCAKNTIFAQSVTHCETLYIITDHETEEITTPEGFQIHVIPIWEWLLQGPQL